MTDIIQSEISDTMAESYETKMRLTELEMHVKEHLGRLYDLQSADNLRIQELEKQLVELKDYVDKEILTSMSTSIAACLGD